MSEVQRFPPDWNMTDFPQRLRQLRDLMPHRNIWQIITAPSVGSVIHGNNPLLVVNGNDEFRQRLPNLLLSGVFSLLLSLLLFFGKRGCPTSKGTFDNFKQCLFFDRLGDVIKGSEPNGLGRCLYTGIAGDHDHRTLLARLFDMSEDFNAGCPIENDIADNQIDPIRIFFQDTKSLLKAGSRQDIGITRTIEQHLKGKT